MILPNWLPFAVGIAVAAVIIFLILKRRGKDEASLRLALFTGILLVEEKDGEGIEEEEEEIDVD